MTTIAHTAVGLDFITPWPRRPALGADILALQPGDPPMDRLTLFETTRKSIDTSIADLGNSPWPATTLRRDLRCSLLWQERLS